MESGEWVSVESSWVRAVRRDAPDRLAVQTKAGKILNYAGCDENMYEQLLQAPSKGSFVSTVVKRQCQFLG